MGRCKIIGTSNFRIIKKGTSGYSRYKLIEKENIQRTMKVAQFYSQDNLSEFSAKLPFNSTETNK